MAFFIYGICYGSIYLKDSFEYLNQSVNLLNHGSWYSGKMDVSLVPQLYSLRPPGYGFFIMLLHLVVHSNIIISMTQTLLSIFNCYLAIRIIQLFSSPSINSRWFVLPFLFFPSQFIYANMIMPEMLLQTAIMIAVWFLIDFFKHQHNRSLLYFQLSITAALLVKPVFFIFPLFSFGLVMFAVQGLKHKSTALLMHIIPVTVFFLVSFFNYEKTGYFEYSSVTQKLLINYYARYTTAFNHGDAYAIKEIDSLENAALLAPTYAEKVQTINTGAMKLISNNKSAFVLLSLKGMFNFFVDHSRYDMESFAGNIPDEKSLGWHATYKQEGLSGLVNYVIEKDPFYYSYLFISMLINLILLIGLFLFTFNKQNPFYLRLIIMTFILYTAILTGMTGTTRFRLPVFLLIIIGNILHWGQYKLFCFQKEKTSPSV